MGSIRTTRRMTQISSISVDMGNMRIDGVNMCIDGAITLELELWGKYASKG